jgi:hypothetical protein
VAVCGVQQADEKGGDEDAEVKVVPKWKATHITAIPLEPENDDDPTAPLPPSGDDVQQPLSE